MNGTDLNVVVGDWNNPNMGEQLKTLGLNADTPLHALDVLECSDFGTFASILKIINTPAARRYSRLMATRLAVEAASFALPQDLDNSAVSLMEATEDAIRAGGSLLPFMERANNFGNLADFYLQQADDSPYFALGAARDVFLEIDFIPDETCCDEDLDEHAAGAARRVYESLLETVVRTTPELKAATKIAQIALDGEERWQKGTNTHFDLISEPVNAALDALRAEITNNGEVLAALDTLCRMACKGIIEEMERSR